MRLMSASIAAITVTMAVRAAGRPRMAAGRPIIPSLALRAWSMKAAVSAGKPDPKYHREASDLILEGYALTDQFLARGNQRADGGG
jgi:hypothetical protein